MTWWHGVHYANVPIDAARRLIAKMPDVDVRLWMDAGHLEFYHRHDEIHRELLGRASDA